MVIEYDFIIELKRIQSELNQIFDRFFNATSGSDTYYPGVNILIHPEKVRVIFDLPGVDQNTLRVSILGQDLLVKGEKRLSEASQKGKPIRVERGIGVFYRTVPIPCAVNARGAIARWGCGLLEIELPRISDRRSTRIEIPVQPLSP